MSDIVCSCGHPAEYHNDRNCRCSDMLTGALCRCGLSNDAVEARHWARRMKAECDALRGDLKAWAKYEQDDVMKLRGQLIVAQAELDGFKSGAKKGAEWMKSELERIEDENNKLRARLAGAVEALKRMPHNVNHNKHYECLGCIADVALQRIGDPHANN